ncbi:hypothetical protein BBB39_09100 [Bordetella trematum]|uniref:Uncharacterized protein n=1 Tax=Bordetella trematum TaxID=123899 RepID=A0A157QAP0_9BORD|nr:hypothetical protein [Bordetella trematum]AZR93909.1 hypothetical protein BBB39_09100 [Bordetella trematum]NNH19039.1 hypothetical protein [Bordetella trematum]SAI42827.1 Uncharacterised protein [Bordetella trematum]SAI72178.1 Uncharacterised protein [Bordetella trematum]SPU49863.1 Uncharacterised protein [Bordetella trematum]
MEIDAQIWVTLGLAFLAGALKLAKDRPRLLEEWVDKITGAMFVVQMLLIGASLMLAWVRWVVAARLDGVMTEEHVQALLWVAVDMGDAARLVVKVILATIAISAFAWLLLWFGRAWNKSAMPTPPGEGSQKPGSNPDVRKERQDASVDASKGEPK